MALRTSVAQAVALTIAMRWADRLISLLSTVILARLLLPADFGIIAMGSLVLGLLDVLLDLGVNIALIQNRNPTQSHYDTAWTLRLAQSATAALLVFALAPLAAGYFGDQRVAPVLRLMALMPLVTGLENIGVVTFQKEMQFGMDFRFVFMKRICVFLATLAAAWLLRSYWTLVIGPLIGRLCGVVFSYRLHPMRPRLSLACFRDIFGISQWNLLRSLGNYLNQNLHTLLVGRRETAAVMGGYVLASEISALPSTELLAPISRVLLPAFALVKDDPVELKRQYLLAQAIQALVGIPAGVGLVLVAHEAVTVLLGERWLLAVPFVQVMGLINIMQAIMTSGSSVLIVRGRIYTVALYSWLQVLLFAALAFIAIPAGGAMAIAWLRLGLAAFGLLSFFWLLLRVLTTVRVRDILNSVLRPLLATGGMAAFLLLGTGDLDLDQAAMLLLKMAMGVFSYGVTLLGLWHLAGRPAGAESYLLDQAIARLPKRLPPAS